MDTISMGELYGALAAARLEFDALTKTKTANIKSDKGSYGYSYADLSDIIAATAPALAKHGLTVIQEPEVSADGGRTLVTVYGSIAHKSGAAYALRPLSLPVAGGTAQAIGSAISYGRRYQLQAALNLAADDDDAQAAQPQPQRQQGATQPQKAQDARNSANGSDTPNVTVDTAAPVNPDGPVERGQPISETTRKRLHALGTEVYGDQWDDKRPELVRTVSKGAVEHSADLTENEARRLCAGMEAKRAQVQQDGKPRMGQPLAA